MSLDRRNIFLHAHCLKIFSLVLKACNVVSTPRTHKRQNSLVAHDGKHICCQARRRLNNDVGHVARWWLAIPQHCGPYTARHAGNNAHCNIQMTSTWRVLVGITFGSQTIWKVCTSHDFLRACRRFLKGISSSEDSIWLELTLQTWRRHPSTSQHFRKCKTWAVIVDAYWENFNPIRIHTRHEPAASCGYA